MNFWEMVAAYIVAAKRSMRKIAFLESNENRHTLRASVEEVRGYQPCET